MIKIIRVEISAGISLYNNKAKILTMFLPYGKLIRTLNVDYIMTNPWNQPQKFLSRATIEWIFALCILCSLVSDGDGACVIRVENFTWSVEVKRKLNLSEPQKYLRHFWVLSCIFLFENYLEEGTYWLNGKSSSTRRYTFFISNPIFELSLKLL